MAEFKPAFDRLMELEGGYVNDKADRGGATRYGITEKAARLSGYAGDMARFPVEMAEQIYRRSYWDGLRCSEFNSQALANVVFDFGVNAGLSACGKCLQRALGLTEDGIIGSHTITAANLEGP